MRLAAIFMAASQRHSLSAPLSAQTPVKVKIGVLNDQSGLYADLGGTGLGLGRQEGGGRLRRHQ